MGTWLRNDKWKNCSKSFKKRKQICRRQYSLGRTFSFKNSFRGLERWLSHSELPAWGSCRGLRFRFQNSSGTPQPLVTPVLGRGWVCGSDAFLTSAGSHEHMVHIHALSYINKCPENKFPSTGFCVFDVCTYDEHVCCCVCSCGYMWKLDVVDVRILSMALRFASFWDRVSNWTWS